MIKIVIITKTHIGPATPVPWFVDKELNIVKKSKYYTLKNNLKEKLAEDNIEADVQVNNHDDIDYIKREGVDLIIISPYLKKFLIDQIQKKIIIFYLSESIFQVI